MKGSVEKRATQHSRVGFRAFRDLRKILRSKGWPPITMLLRRLGIATHPSRLDLGRNYPVCGLGFAPRRRLLMLRICGGLYQNEVPLFGLGFAIKHPRCRSPSIRVWTSCHCGERFVLAEWHLDLITSLRACYVSLIRHPSCLWGGFGLASRLTQFGFGADHLCGVWAPMIGRSLGNIFLLGSGLWGSQTSSGMYALRLSGLQVGHPSSLMMSVMRVSGLQNSMPGESLYFVWGLCHSTYPS